MTKIDELSSFKDVMLERVRQITDYGYGQDHDDAQYRGEIIWAKGGALNRITRAIEQQRLCNTKKYRCLLVKAAAQIIAEIERLDRLHAGGGEHG